MKINNLIQVRKILTAHSNDKMPTALAYKMMKLLKASDNEDAFYTQKFKDIIENYSQKDEKGNLVFEKENVKIQEDKIFECQEAINNLENTEVEKPAILFTVKELSDLKFTIKEIYILDEFIDEDV